MANRQLGAGLQIVFLIILLLLIAFSALFWFDFMDIIDSRAVVSTVGRLFGISPSPVVAQTESGTGILDAARLAMDQEALTIRDEELTKRKNELDERETQVRAQEEALVLREQKINDTEKTLNEKLSQYENVSAVYEKNAQDLINMPPPDAVEIMVNYDDQLLIDVLLAADAIAERAGEQSLVSYWLSLFPSPRVADIQRKMTLRPGSNAN